MNLAIADIETVAIPQEGILSIDTIHCISVKSDHEDTRCYTSYPINISNYAGTLQEGLAFINQHKQVAFHNGISFDLPVIENLLGPITAEIVDTIILAKLLYTTDELIELDVTIPDFPKDKYGSFSLDAFGRRLGEYKGSYNDWSTLTIEMAEYCNQDVEVTYQLYYNLIEHDNYPIPKRVIDLEYQVAYHIAEQSYYGFYFDTDKAREIYTRMQYEKMSIEIRLQKIFRPKFLPVDKPIVPAGARRNKIYEPNPDFQVWNALDYFPYQYKIQKNGKTKLLAYTNFKWFDEPHRLVYSYTVGEYQKIKLTKFAPGSRNKIKLWLKQDYNFDFATVTEIGNQKVNGDELETLGDKGKDLRRYLKLVKDMSQLRNDESGNGLLNRVREHSHAIHGRVDTIGAATHRCTHSGPNLAQIPQDGEFRQLFSAPPEMVLVGADLANIELRVLAHYLYPYDDGKYAEAVLSKDMHWYHTGLAGFYETDGVDYDEHNPEHKAARNKAKSFVFGWLTL